MLSMRGGQEKLSTEEICRRLLLLCCVTSFLANRKKEKRKIFFNESQIALPISSIPTSDDEENVRARERSRSNILRRSATLNDVEISLLARLRCAINKSFLKIAGPRNSRCTWRDFIRFLDGLISACTTLSVQLNESSRKKKTSWNARSAQEEAKIYEKNLCWRVEIHYRNFSLSFTL